MRFEPPLRIVSLWSDRRPALAAPPVDPNEAEATDPPVPSVDGLLDCESDRRRAASFLRPALSSAPMAAVSVAMPSVGEPALHMVTRWRGGVDTVGRWAGTFSPRPPQYLKEV